MKKIYFTKEQKEYLQKQLINKKSLTNIAKEMGYSVDTVSRIAKEIMPTFDFKRKSFVDLTYFSKIDTPEKAYWLGFIAADGYICGNELNIQLQQQDKKHLQKFSNAINGNLTIRDINGKNNLGTSYSHYRVSIRSSQIVEDLKNNGVYQNKSLTLKPPNLNQNLFGYWILGYLDGDGNIQKNKKKFRINITGTKDVISSIKDYLKSNNKISLENKCQNTYRIQLENDISMNFLKTIDYCNLDFCLDRKKELVSLYSSFIQ